MSQAALLDEKKRLYHHGGLRRALLDAGMQALETQDLAAISLRQLARDVGVSATAVYRHFPDKNALMGEIAVLATERLGEFQFAAAKDAATVADAFEASGRAYVRFAIAFPALFRLICTQPHPDGIPIFGDSLPARLLQDYARSLKASEEEAQRLMIQGWSVVHGLAMLMLEGNLPKDDALIDTIVDMKQLFQLGDGSSKLASP